MCIIRFDYFVYQKSKSPIIPVAIFGRREWKITWAYVDSGASYSIFSAEDAQRLGLSLSQGERISMVVGDGGHIPVYLFKLPIKIEDVKIEAMIGFSPRLGVGFNLLGRKDVFERFKICFDDGQGVLTFMR